jgi:hypothetical protein
MSDLHEDAQPSRGTADLVVFLAGAGMSALIDWVDSRPHWDDSGITAGVLFLSAAVLSALWPRRPWLIGLTTGVVLWAHLMLRTIEARHYGARALLMPLLVFLFPLAGAYAGALTRGLFPVPALHR